MSSSGRQRGPETRPGYVVPTVDTDLPYTTVWTDGSSTGAWGPAGWAYCVVDGPLAGTEASGADPWSTNQRAELQAAHEAMKAIPGLLLIVSDSAYVTNCFLQSWYVAWAARDYRNVKNDDLWRPFVADYIARAGTVRFAWVKGHAGLDGNERADLLSRAARLALPVADPPAAGDQSPAA